MGVISPNPYVTDEVFESFKNDIMNPTLKGMQAEGMDFEGVIFFGLMITAKGVYLLEYNMRLGDPETQAVLPLLENDLLELVEYSFDKKIIGIKCYLETTSCLLCCRSCRRIPMKVTKKVML